MEQKRVKTMKIITNKIIEEVCREFGISRTEINQKSRVRHITIARSIACWLIDKHNAENSVRGIARHFEGIGEHAVYNCLKNVSNWAEFDSYLKKKIARIESNLNIEKILEAFA